jgi:hypothetical protein
VVEMNEKRDMNVLFSNRLIDSLICSDRSKEIERESIKGEISYFYLLMRQLSILDPSERNRYVMYLMESTLYVERPSAL